MVDLLLPPSTAIKSSSVSSSLHPPDGPGPSGLVWAVPHHTGDGSPQPLTEMSAERRAHRTATSITPARLYSPNFSGRPFETRTVYTSLHHLWVQARYVFPSYCIELTTNKIDAACQPSPPRRRDLQVAAGPVTRLLKEVVDCSISSRF